MPDYLNTIKEKLENYGFNLFGITTIKEYNSHIDTKYYLSGVYKEYQSIVLIASGGKKFWETLNNFMTTPQGKFLNNTEHFIDTYTEYCLNLLQKDFPEIIGKIIYPFKENDALIDFQKIAYLAGFGHISPYIKLLLHPVFGSWVSMRAIFLSKEEFKPTGPLNTDNPCSNCYRPCLDACPVGAVSNEIFDFKVCGEYRVKETDCLEYCHVRKSCIIGPEHIYSEHEGLHRNKFSLRTIRKYYGIS